MDLIDNLVSLSLQASSLSWTAGYIWLIRRPRVRRHRQRLWIIAGATAGLVLLIALHIFLWGSFVNRRHPTLIDGRPVQGGRNK